MSTTQNEEEKAAPAGLLAGKVCVVSGVGPGLGRQAAALASHGADLVLAARRQSNLDEVAAEAREIGSRVVAVSTNVTNADACARLMEVGAEEFGGIDVLVNNAFRMDVFQTFEEVDLAMWRKIMDVNLFGSLQMTRAALPFMRRRGGGSVVMVASMVASSAAAATGRLRHFEGRSSHGYPGLGVRARAFQRSRQRRGPGLDGRTFRRHLHRYGIDRPRCARSKGGGRAQPPVPLGDIPSDEEVAGSIVYLASDLSSAMTGQALDTNGGEIFA